MFWSSKGDQLNKALKPALRFFMEVLRPWGEHVETWALKKQSSRDIYKTMKALQASIDQDTQFAEHDREMFKGMVDVFGKIAILLCENEVYYGDKIEQALDLIAKSRAKQNLDDPRRTS